MFAGSRTAAPPAARCTRPRCRRRVASARSRPPGPFADARGRHTFADAIDLARAVALRDHARKRDLAAEAGAAFDVGKIDPGGPSRTRTSPRPVRGLHVIHMEDFAGGSVLFVIGGAMGRSCTVVIDLAWPDLEHSACRRSRWSAADRAGDPDLRAEFVQFGIECNPAQRVEVRNHLVESSTGAKPTSRTSPACASTRRSRQRFLLRPVRRRRRRCPC